MDQTNNEIYIFIPGAGLCFPYLFGAMEYLKLQSDNLKINIKHYSGVSAGSLVATIYALGLNPFLFIKLCYDDEIINNKNMFGLWFILEDTLRGVLKKYLPDDINYQDIDNLAIRLSEATSRKTYYIDKFNSKDDLINCIIASCYIPLFLSYRMTCYFRGKYYIDGASLQANNYHCNCQTMTIPSLLERKEMFTMKKHEDFEHLFVRGGQDCQYALIARLTNSEEMNTVSTNCKCERSYEFLNDDLFDLSSTFDEEAYTFDVKNYDSIFFFDEDEDRQEIINIVSTDPETIRNHFKKHLEVK